MTKDEALKIALKALEMFRYHIANNYEINAAIVAAREALAQPEQETEAWHEIVLNQKQFLDKMESLLANTAAPPQRTWEGLSVFEINDLVKSTEYEDYQDLVERTEAKLMEKNT